VISVVRTIGPENHIYTIVNVSTCFLLKTDV